MILRGNSPKIMTDQNTEASQGWASRLATRPLWQRVTAFASIIFAVIAFFFVLTAFFVYQSASSLPRAEPIALTDAITHAEYITFDEPDVFPGALAMDDASGTLYTGSYGMGSVWASMGAGDAQLLAGTGEQIGSVSGLDVGADGTLYILDRVTPVQSSGAIVWQYQDGVLEQVTQFPTQGRNAVQIPNDIAVDDGGNLYMVDFGLQQIWQITPDAEAALWWEAPAEVAPAGLAFDSVNQRLLVTDGATDTIYALPVADPDASEVLYTHTNGAAPGFNGIDMSADGTIYVSALALNRVARLGEDGTLIYLAESFRGSSDVAYDETTGQLFVNNWDSSWLLPVRLLFLAFDVDARLPFSVDVLTGEL